ncbi:hypothetical protein GGR21_002632 [Dysgonomonas hofstadii]|uniref:Uncharacterized protein n=1 Tax=Dysgonomonas hofstadii TaxID=637886 RepID=A0A840CMV2_9BACT|nr:hypothetical protein [Dysgonomonas hofstadii]MBB4036726.1 hypothetical protein [Dysgonomonas hofstadii]
MKFGFLSVSNPEDKIKLIEFGANIDGIRLDTLRTLKKKKELNILFPDAY